MVSYVGRFMLKRASALVICLMLALLAPLPLSACAALAGLPAECQPEPECAAMDSMEACATMAMQMDSTSCCQVSAAPLPQAQQKVATPDISADPLPVLHLAVAVVQPDFDAAAVSWNEHSPPDVQSVLCTFLI